MAYVDFPNSQQGMKDRKKFWLSDDGIALIDQWRREGIAYDDIAIRYIGIGTTTMWRWTKESPELARALRITKDVTNSKVEGALLKRALGYDYDEVTKELVEGEMRVTKTIRKHVSPDVKACLAWLCNRRADRWRMQPVAEGETDDMKTAKKILVAIKEVADGNASGTQPETD